MLRSGTSAGSSIRTDCRTMQRPIVLLAWLCVALAAHAGARVGTAHAKEIIGIAEVTEGASLNMCAQGSCAEFQLCGIETPEPGTPSHEASLWALRSFVLGRTVRCVPQGSGTPCDGLTKPTSRTRGVAQCFTDDGDVADFMIRNGYACYRWSLSDGYYARIAGARVCDTRSRNRH